jgi:hypothetical protein
MVEASRKVSSSSIGMAACGREAGGHEYQERPQQLRQQLPLQSRSSVMLTL